MVFYLWNAEFVLMSNIAWKASMSMTLKESGWQHQEGEGLQGWGGGSWGRTKCFGAVMAIGYEKRVGKIAAHCDLSLECYLRFWKESDYWCTWLLSVTFDCSCTWDYLRWLGWPETWDIYLRIEIFTWDLGFLLETWVLHVMLLEKQYIQ